MVKTIVSVMKQYAEQAAKEPQEGQSMVATATLTDDTVNLSSLALEQEGTFIKISNVLLVRSHFGSSPKPLLLKPGLRALPPPVSPAVTGGSLLPQRTREH